MVEQEPASGSGFTAAVSAITDAFGDPTRRRIYLFTREAGRDEGVTVATVAAEVGVHPNVARHHLDKLAAGGYVEVVPHAATSTAGVERIPTQVEMSRYGKHVRTVPSLDSSVVICGAPKALCQ